jgi:hypothetical protein
MHLKVFVKLKKTLKTLSSRQKKPKNPKKTKKTKKNHWACFFIKKTRVFSNPESSCAFRLALLALLALSSQPSYYCRLALRAPARQINYCSCRLVLLPLASQPFLFLFIGWLLNLLTAFLFL